MKKLSLTALCALALTGLVACEGETVTNDPGADTYAAENTGPVDVELPDTNISPDEVDTDRDSVSINEDGVRADIRDGNTSVNADLDGDPSLDVTVD